MNNFRELFEKAYLAHTEFKKAWKVYEPYCMTTIEPKKVTEARNKFDKAIDVLYDSLPLENLFLAGDSEAIDSVLDFVEIDIPAFRCGYAKEWYFRKLKYLPLNETQKARLRQLAYKLCRSPNYRREFAYIARLMIKLADKPLIRELQKLSKSPDELVQKKAEHMLNVILHHRKDLNEV